MKTAIYTLTSELHNEKAVDPSQVYGKETHDTGVHYGTQAWRDIRLWQ